MNCAKLHDNACHCQRQFDFQTNNCCLFKTLLELCLSKLTVTLNFHDSHTMRTSVSNPQTQRAEPSSGDVPRPSSSKAAWPISIPHPTSTYPCSSDLGNYINRERRPIPQSEENRTPSASEIRNRSIRSPAFSSQRLRGTADGLDVLPPVADCVERRAENSSPSGAANTSSSHVANASSSQAENASSSQAANARIRALDVQALVQSSTNVKSVISRIPKNITYLDTSNLLTEMNVTNVGNAKCL